MANYVKGIGDATSRINEIIPKFDAQILNFLIQSTPGVCWSETNRFAIATSGRSVLISAGMVHAYGYFGMSDAITQIDFVMPTSATQYARIYAEINLSVTPHRFSIKATAQSSSSNIGLTQNNLATTPSGVYQIPLYLLTISSNGVITATDQRPQNTKPEHAKNAEQSINSTNANNLVSGGTIASNVTAVTQAQSDNTTKLATTAYVRSAIATLQAITTTYGGTSARNIWGDGEWGSYTAPNGVMFQWYTANNQSNTFRTAFPNACVFCGYVGHHGSASNNSPWATDIGISYSDISRTGFKWKRQSGTSGVNQRKYLAIGY